MNWSKGRARELDTRIVVVIYYRVELDQDFLLDSAVKSRHLKCLNIIKEIMTLQN